MGIKYHSGANFSKPVRHKMNRKMCADCVSYPQLTLITQTTQRFSFPLIRAAFLETR
ncbi:MAG: hypothetical protein ACJAVM_001755 [Sulfitobacter sp.]|jgi:hypothetical protein